MVRRCVLSLKRNLVTDLSRSLRISLRPRYNTRAQIMVRDQRQPCKLSPSLGARSVAGCKPRLDAGTLIAASAVTVIV